jgi:hypothetical protein
VNGIVEKIRRYPTLFGVLIGLLMFGSIIVLVNWFPRVDQAWDRNNANVRSGFFTVGFFAIVISRVWRWRQRNARVFWAAVCTFLLLHALGVVFYSIWLRPLLLRDWIFLMIIESFALVFGLDWLTKRFKTAG